MPTTVAHGRDNCRTDKFLNITSRLQAFKTVFIAYAIACLKGCQFHVAMCNYSRLYMRQLQLTSAHKAANFIALCTSADPRGRAVWACVCGRSLARTASLNPARGTDVCLL